MCVWLYGLCRVRQVGLDTRKAWMAIEIPATTSISVLDNKPIV